MNVLTITAVKTWYVVDIGDSRIHMLNLKSLTHFLKRQVGLDRTAIHSILSAFNYEAKVTINLDHVAMKVS